MSDVIGRLEDMRRAIGGTAKRYPHLSVRAISRLFRCWPSEVAAALRHVGLERPFVSADDKLTAENVKADLAAGLKTEAISRKYLARPEEIRALIDPAIPREIPQEVQPVSACALPDPSPEDIAKLRAARVSWGDISLQLGCPRSVVCRVATDNGFAGEPIEAERYLSKASQAPDTAGQPEPEPQAEATTELAEEPTMPDRAGRRRNPAPPLAEVARRRARGLSWKRIAEELGSSTGTVHKMGQDAQIHASYVHAQAWCEQHGVAWREEHPQLAQPPEQPAETAATWPGPCEADAPVPTPVYPVRTLDEIKADLEAATREPEHSLKDLCDGLQHRARGILPKGLGQRLAEPPVELHGTLTLDLADQPDETLFQCFRRNLPGADARRYVTGFAGILDDQHRYDVQIIVREVVAQ